MHLAISLRLQKSNPGNRRIQNSATCDYLAITLAIVLRLKNIEDRLFVLGKGYSVFQEREAASIFQEREPISKLGA